MVENKTFESLEKLNEFIMDDTISIINIETKEISYNTGLPLPNGGSFMSTQEVFNLFYKQNKK